MTQNPLSKFFRAPKAWVKLPSQGHFYPENFIELDDDGQVPIMPMTAQDEVMLKNPDALLSGEAVSSVIKSCVPSIQQPKKLLSCDVDALLIGIRIASNGDQTELETKCPACSADNSYTVDLATLVDTAETLSSQYEVVLPSGLSVYVTPGTFETLIRQQKAVFEGKKVERIVRDNNVSDEARLKMFSEVFSKMSRLEFESVLAATSRVVYTADDGQIQEITDRKMISEFYQNVSKADVELIKDMIKHVNSHGVTREMSAVCRNCGHEWQLPLEFNESNFF